MPKLSSRTLVVIADGERAILFRNKGVGDDIDLQDAKRVTPDNLLDDGPSGSRPEEQTQQQTDEATFAKQLTQRLNAMCLKGEFETLILAADPQTLGQMRGIMHKTVEAALLISLAKDLTHHSAQEIAAAIKNAM